MFYPSFKFDFLNFANSKYLSVRNYLTQFTIRAVFYFVIRNFLKATNMLQ